MFYPVTVFANFHGGFAFALGFAFGASGCAGFAFVGFAGFTGFAVDGFSPSAIDACLHFGAIDAFGGAVGAAFGGIFASGSFFVADLARFTNGFAAGDASFVFAKTGRGITNLTFFTSHGRAIFRICTVITTASDGCACESDTDGSDCYISKTV